MTAGPQLAAKLAPNFAATDTVVFAPLANRSKAYVTQHFGNDVNWAGINSAVWSAIAARNDHALTLTEMDAVARIASAESNEVLAVLALLSRPGSGLLKMEYLGNGGDDGATLSRDEVGKKLKAWWKDKTMHDDEWRSWAGNVVVKWCPVEEEENSR